MEEETLDILIRGGIVLTISKDKDVIDNGEIGIRDGRIEFVRAIGTDLHRPEAKEIINAENMLVMPGLVNTHTHLPMIYFRGLADDLPLNEWLVNHIFPAEARFVNSEFCRNGANLAIAEMILSGTTTFCDAYFYPESIAQAAIESKMRGVICAGFADFPAPGNPDPARNAEVARAFLDTWTGFSSLITPALFCHAPYTCAPETFRDIKDIARSKGALFMTHLAETKWEVEDIKNRYGDTPVRLLSKLGILDEKTVAVHCNWLDDEEISIMADCGAKVSHNPESSMKLAAGVAPVPAMLEKGITVGLGTDGCASNNDLDLIKEMGTAAKIHKAVTLDPTVMDARTVLELATIEGAKVLGMEKEIGSIEKGKRADILLIDLNKPHLTPLYNPYSHVVYSASGADVTTSIIDGKVVMRNRNLTTIDINAAVNWGRVHISRKREM
ncbi:MAG: amidohydrolase [Syntrophales bacterium]|nr:amidohydrolase [Syntrophales bacterium]